MTKLSPDDLFALQGAPLHRVVGDEVFILMPDSRMHWLRNATAKALWDALVDAGDRGITGDDLANTISLQFDIEPARALPDVLGFLESLAARGLVRRL